jgi:hypothetical protein
MTAGAALWVTFTLRLSIIRPLAPALLQACSSSCTFASAPQRPWDRVTALCIAVLPYDNWMPTVGHRMELLQYHTHVLEHMGNARWELSTVHEYQERTALKHRTQGS